MHASLPALLTALLVAGCATPRREAPERWLTKHQHAEHYHHSELAPERRVREVPAAVHAQAVASLTRKPFREVSGAELRRFGGEALEMLPGQMAFLLRAVRPANGPHRIEVYRDHLPHKGHKEPPPTVTTLARGRGAGFSGLEKTAVLYIDSRPPERLNVDYALRR